jgi:hypothetical protein
MRAGEVVDAVADDDAEVLEAHPVDALMDRQDELDERNGLAIQDVERLGQQNLRDRPAVPDVLEVRDGMPLQERADMDVAVPLGDADREVAQGVRRDVDTAIRQAIALLGRERPVVADDVRDRVGHRPAPTAPEPLLGRFSEKAA